MSLDCDPRVTIVINCRNGFNTLPATLASIESQTYTNYSVLFIDNWSTDGSSSLLQRYDFDFLILKTPAPCTLGCARAFALSQVTSPFAALIDSDDVWFPDRLASHLQFLYSLPSMPAISYAGLNMVLSSSGRQLFSYFPTCTSSSFFHQTVTKPDINLSTILINIPLLRSAKLNFNPDIVIAEEIDLALRTSLYFDVTPFPRVLSNYYINPNSLTHTKRKYSYADSLKTYFTLKRLLLQLPLQKSSLYPLRLYLNKLITYRCIYSDSASLKGKIYILLILLRRRRLTIINLVHFSISFFSFLFPRKATHYRLYLLSAYFTKFLSVLRKVRVHH